MVKRVTQLDLQRVVQKGASIERVPALVQIPELAALFEKFHQAKNDRSKRHEANFEKKLAKMDEIVKAIEAAGKKSTAVKPVDLGPVMKLLNDIRKEHQGMKAELAALPEHSENELCDYKLTGSRDQRGLIDLEKGLTFTAVPR